MSTKRIFKFIVHYLYSHSNTGSIPHLHSCCRIHYLLFDWHVWSFCSFHKFVRELTKPTHVDNQSAVLLQALSFVTSSLSSSLSSLPSNTSSMPLSSSLLFASMLTIVSSNASIQVLPFVSLTVFFLKQKPLWLEGTWTTDSMSWCDKGLIPNFFSTRYLLSINK